MLVSTRPRSNSAHAPATTTTTVTVTTATGTTATAANRDRTSSWSSEDPSTSSSEHHPSVVGSKKPRLASEELFEENRNLALRQQEPDAESKSALLLLEFQKLRAAQVLTDVSFKCGPHAQVVKAHASFLLAVCPALGRKLMESANFELVLPHASAAVVGKIVDFLYSNEMIRVKTERELAQIKLVAADMSVSIPDDLLALSALHYVNRSTLLGHMGYVCALILTEDGLLVSGSRDNSIRVWDYAGSTSSKVELSDIHSDRVWALLRLKNSQNQERILSGSWDSTISVINPTTWKVEKRLSGHTDWVTCLCLVDKHFASGSADGTVRVWTIGDNSFQPERVLRGHRGHVYAMCASDEALFSAGNDGFICVWDKQNWRRLARMDAHPKNNIRALVWSSRLNCLLSGASDGKIRVWTKPTTAMATFSMEHEVNNAHADWVEALVEMNQCRLASGSRDCTVRIWKANSPRKWELLQSIRQHSHWVYALVFTPENVLVSASCDMTIKIWEEEKEPKDEDEVATGKAD